MAEGKQTHWNLHTHTCGRWDQCCETTVTSCEPRAPFNYSSPNLQTNSSWSICVSLLCKHRWHLQSFTRPREVNYLLCRVKWVLHQTRSYLTFSKAEQNKWSTEAPADQSCVPLGWLVPFCCFPLGPVTDYNSLWPHTVFGSTAEQLLKLFQPSGQASTRRYRRKKLAQLVISTPVSFLRITDSDADSPKPPLQHQASKSVLLHKQEECWEVCLQSPYSVDTLVALHSALLSWLQLVSLHNQEHRAISPISTDHPPLLRSPFFFHPSGVLYPHWQEEQASWISLSTHRGSNSHWSGPKSKFIRESL